MSWETVVVATWLAGISLLTLKHAAGWIFLQHLRRTGVTPLGFEWDGVLARLCRVMKLRNVTVRWSSRVRGPVAFGWWRPVILLPLSLASGLSRPQIEMILAHEMAHLWRNDYLINLAQSVVEMMLFYHPATWWMGRQIRREREHACDDIALRVIQDSGAYARALVALAELEISHTPSFALAASGPRRALYARIERLLRPPSDSPAPRALPGIGAVLAVILAVSLPSAQQEVHAQTTKLDASAELLRGDIRDRNGIVLATTDKPDRQIVFDLDELVKAWHAAHPGEELPTYARHYLAKGDNPNKGQFHERPMLDAAKMFSDSSFPKLEEHRLAVPYNTKLFRESGNWRQAGDRWVPNVPGTVAVYRRFLSEEDWKRAEAVKAQVPGMKTRVLKFRHYPLGALAVHTLGYVKEENLVERRLTEKIGVMGVEQAWDAALRPKHEDGQPTRRGDDVYLTLDARHQMIVEQALRQAGVGRGAAVLLQVDSGDVLAIASVPSFDAAELMPSITKEKYEQYLKDPSTPFLNRTQGAYAPGASFTPVTCLAAVMSGHENLVCDCTGSMDIGSKTMHCWTPPPGHGHLDMAGGLETSCNVYFYNLGIATGMDQLSATARLLGFGKKSGIGLYNDEAGSFPDASLIEKKDGRKWNNASTANAAIGQGYTLATPVQMAGLISTVANGGTVWRPRLLDRIVSSRGGSTSEQPKIRNADLHEHGLAPAGLETIRRGLFANVNGDRGPARKASGGNPTIAGRTGTAQTWRAADGEKESHAWFICYAPADQPRWALAVFVQNGKTGGGVAAPIAKHILEQVAAVEAGTLKVELKPLPPAKGHLNPVDEVKFETEEK